MDATFLLTALSALALAAWVYLAIAHGGFWRGGPFLPSGRGRESWPAVVAVVPARDEADVVRTAVSSIAAQDYPGRLGIVVVDDNSADATADEARAAGTDARPVDIVTGAALPTAWIGKVWAMNQGVARAEDLNPDAQFVWLTDADIEHHPGELTALVSHAEDETLPRDLVSLMVRLHCRTFWERFLIPAFVFFFRKLYPFARANDPDSRLAAAAGGSMLVRRAALNRIGGLQAIRDKLIDDCGLAREIKSTGGAVWIGLARHTNSIRVYDTLGEIWRTVARTAFHQLRYSPLLLIGTLIGMLLLYVWPVAAVVSFPWHGSAAVSALGAAAWCLMAALYLPVLRYYGRPMWEAAVLPAAGVLYTLMTADSARRHWQGKGGGWKARTYSETRSSAS